MLADNPFNALMDAICVDLGYCGSIQDGKPVHVTHFIPEEGDVTADQFVEWVFLADDIKADFTSPKWQHHRDALRRLFIEHMGDITVPATQLNDKL